MIKANSPLLKQSTFQRQTQHLMALPQMQQAFQLMQLPILELAALVSYHLEQNPILSEIGEEFHEEEQEDEEEELTVEQDLTLEETDFSTLKLLEEDFKDYQADWEYPHANDQAEFPQKNLIEQMVKSTLTLFEFLMQQAEEFFTSPTERRIAEQIIGNLTPEGYFTSPPEEIAKALSVPVSLVLQVLQTVQTFEPYGIAATHLQESLLIQLRALGKQDTLSESILKDHFDDLLHHRITSIAKKLNCSIEQIDTSIRCHLTLLDFHPGTTYTHAILQPIVADAVLKDEGGELKVMINDEYLPAIRFNSRYLAMMQDKTQPSDVYEFLHHKLASAKWLLRNIHQRNETLRRLVTLLADKQQQFLLDPQGKLSPMTMKSLANDLNLHESTVTRAVANKYVDCPRGLLSLRSFFSTSYISEQGDQISSQTIRDALLKLIRNEDKQHTLSDAKLAELLKKQGIICARRTIAKYRTELNIGNAQQRKKF